MQQLDPQVEAYPADDRRSSPAGTAPSQPIQRQQQFGAEAAAQAIARQVQQLTQGADAHAGQGVDRCGRQRLLRQRHRLQRMAQGIGGQHRLAITDPGQHVRGMCGGRGSDAVPETQRVQIRAQQAFQPRPGAEQAHAAADLQHDRMRQQAHFGAVAIRHRRQKPMPAIDQLRLVRQRLELRQQRLRRGQSLADTQAGFACGGVGRHDGARVARHRRPAPAAPRWADGEGHRPAPDAAAIGRPTTCPARHQCSACDNATGWAGADPPRHLRTHTRACGSASSSSRNAAGERIRQMPAIAKGERQRAATVGGHLQPPQRTVIRLLRPRQHGGATARAQALLHRPQHVALGRA